VGERECGAEREEGGMLGCGGRQGEIKGSSQFAIWTTLGRTFGVRG